MKQTTISAFCLVLVAAIWGLTFPLINYSMQTQDPFLFVALRFTVAALPILPYFWKRFKKEMLVSGLILGAVHCGAFLTQTIGLQTVSSSRAAFLTSLYVLMIPLISPLFRMGSPNKHDLLSAIGCCCGVYVLIGSDLGGMTVGDVWILLGALFIAISIIYIGKLSTQFSNPYMLAYSQIVITAAFSWIPCITFQRLNGSSFLNFEALGILLLCSLLCTIVAIVLQSKHQKFVSVQSAALIFSLEPVFAALFDASITAALPPLSTLFGGLIILSSILYLELMRTKPVLSSSSE